MKVVLTDNNDVNCVVLLMAQFYVCEVLANIDKGAGSRKTAKLSLFRFYPAMLSWGTMPILHTLTWKEQEKL